jgi:hypothetical protein
MTKKEDLVYVFEIVQYISRSARYDAAGPGGEDEHRQADYESPIEWRPVAHHVAIQKHPAINPARMSTNSTPRIAVRICPTLMRVRP